LKDSSYLVISIDKFSNQLYITIQSKRVISNQHFFQKLNLSRVILKTNTCRMETSYYIFRRVVRTNHNKVPVRLSEVHLILISKKCEIHIISKDKST